MSEPESEAPASSQEASKHRSSRHRRVIRLFLLLAVPASIAAAAYVYLSRDRYVSTDNAYVHQSAIVLATEVRGRVSEVLVRENQQATAGDILFRLDPRPYEIAVAEAEAAVRRAEVEARTVATRASETDVVIQAARADLAFVADAYERQRVLFEQGFTTRSRLQDARQALTKAESELSAAIASQASARAALGRAGEQAYPDIDLARAQLSKARLDLERTVVRAPFTGRVSQTDELRPGHLLESGSPALMLVANGLSWVEANFKETELGDVCLGQPVEIELDIYPGLKLKGKVESIGVATGATFALLPPQNATGNWVKVTQRIPVRIALEPAARPPLLSGLSATVQIDTRPPGHAGC